MFLNVSQELLTNGDESSASSSSSTPGEDIANKVGNTASKAPMMMEAFLKTFEQLAVQQWPTWAKRRGWITDYSDESSSSEILPPDASVENCETVLEGRLRAQAFDQEKTSSTSADLKVNAKDGQDPDLVGDSDDQRVNFESPCGNVAVPIDSLKVPAEGNRMTLIRNNHKASSEKEAAINLAHLYEMSLRWIFEPEVLSEDAAFDDFPLERAGLSVHQDLNNTSKEEFNHQAPTTIRIYIRLLRKSGTEISFIDFRPSSIPSTNLEEAIASASHNYEPKEKHYFVELNNDESKIPLSFPR